MSEPAQPTITNHQVITDPVSGVIRVPNVANYRQETINGALVLIPLKKYITTAEFRQLNFGHSTIIECVVKNNTGQLISNKTKYLGILVDIWKSIPAQKVLQNTSFNIKLTDEKGVKGYNWQPEILMSVQGKAAHETCLEILNFITICSYSMEITIQLQTGQVINYKS